MPFSVLTLSNWHGVRYTADTSFWLNSSGVLVKASNSEMTPQLQRCHVLVLLLACGAHAISPLGHHGGGFKKEFQDGFQQEYGDTAKHQGGGVSDFEGIYKADGGHAAHDGHKKLGGFDHNVGSHHRNEQDQGYYKDVNGQNKQFNDGRQFGGGTDFQTNGKQQSGLNNKGSHKKGHKKEGFENSHHKEESGKTTSFFDESSDGGDHFTSKGSDDYYGNKGGDAFQGGYNKGGLISNGGGKQGHFGGGYSLDDQKGHKGSIGQEGYSGDYKDYGSKGGHNSRKNIGSQVGFGGSGQHGSGYKGASIYGHGGHHGGLGYGGGLVGGAGLGGA
ncbi:hypothetical protein B566_EDAN017866, partial [Ephemera danica]